MSFYEIDGTTNRNIEQLSGAYLDKNFWPNFHNDIEKFKKKLIEIRDKKKSFILLRISHAEHWFFTYLIPKNPIRQGKILGNGIHKRHFNGTQTIEDYCKSFESLINTDYITTQIGYDFKNWLNDIINFKNQYIQYKNKKQLNLLFTNKDLFNSNYKDYKINELINLPFDIIYALVANKWFFKTFKNKIGLIGNCKKLDLIKKLMEHKEYQEYLGNNYFTNYIKIKQKAAINSKHFEQNIYKQIKDSSCNIFLCGMGISKLKIFYKLKEIKNCIYIDVGHGIDALAGLADPSRPYFNSWTNYVLNDHKYRGIDFCGKPGWKKKYKNSLKTVYL